MCVLIDVRFFLSEIADLFYFGTSYSCFFFNIMVSTITSKLMTPNSIIHLNNSIRVIILQHHRIAWFYRMEWMADDITIQEQIRESQSAWRRWLPHQQGCVQHDSHMWPSICAMIFISYPIASISGNIDHYLSSIIVFLILKSVDDH